MAATTEARRVLIAGCGYVGVRLGEELTARGDEVFALRRRPQGLSAPLHPIAADLADRRALTFLPPALDVIVYAASADESSEAAYRRAYVEGLRNLIGASSAPPRRFLFTSSTGVYGQLEGEWVDETSPAEPRDSTGRILLEAETLVHAAPFPSTVVRFGGIYGP
ncbi:MAG: NAD-dependent epimerase/dehydratase family protein, partial [Candidatus Binatia bacterium]